MRNAELKLFDPGASSVDQLKATGNRFVIGVFFFNGTVCQSQRTIVYRLAIKQAEYLGSNRRGFTTFTRKVGCG